MKKVVYILTALLTTAFIVFLTLSAVDFINEEYNSLIAFHEEIFWESISRYLIMAVISLVFIALSLLQLKKSTPRLILIFSGYAFFSSTSFIFAEEWWIPLIYLTASLLPAVYELIKHSRLVKKVPLQLQRYEGMLITAGVLSCMCIAFHIYSVISDMQFYKRFEIDFTATIYYSAAMGVVQCICIAIFCFLRYRRTGVLYRMFFIGMPAIGFLPFLVSLVDIIIRASNADYFYVDPLRVIGSVIPHALAVIVLIHAFKTRHDGLIGQEHTDIAQQAEIPVSQDIHHH